MREDLELYKIFHTVAFYKNISHAAESLYISQPAVSKSIKKLETLLDVKLFSRGSKGVILTAEGKIFYEYIQKALHIIADGENVLTELKNKKQGMITIGVSTVLCKYFLLSHLKPFMKQYPEIKIKIINNTTFDTLKNIDQGMIDFGIVSRPFNISPYTFVKLADIQDIFVAEKEYLDSLQIVEPNDIFSKGIFMLLESDNITRQYIDQFLLENNIFIKPEVEINTMDFLIEFAKIGLGITVAIRNFVEKDLTEGTLIEIPVSPPMPTRTVGIIYDKKRTLSIATETFLSYLQSHVLN
ncbi:LysR family transcriptional regulator [Pelosinus fermentans]|uniref:Transcriptional regulator, LysR family n=1 Tax=Pelosinus fermentans JBW45 TaxID=1192197 RepID=I9NL84_9FIRM|nr:LysR family transcriptional regulator [Pelosinus fermentans]AJQ28939.1 transcriptional regulator, LysR family [Pelosinus fermentans JBW45]